MIMPRRSINGRILGIVKAANDWKKLVADAQSATPSQQIEEAMDELASAEGARRFPALRVERKVELACRCNARRDARIEEELVARGETYDALVSDARAIAAGGIDVDAMDATGVDEDADGNLFGDDQTGDV